MPSRILCKILLMLAAITALPAMAQECLSLAAAVQFALQQHPVTQAAQYDVLAAQATARGARMLRNPEIVITPEMLGSDPADDVVSVLQPLEVNGTRRARTTIAAGKLAAAQAAAQITARDLVLEVSTAYWGLAGAQAIASVDTENLRYAETLVAAAERQVELGNVPTTSITKAKVELARARQQLLRSEAAIAQAQSALNTAMGRDPVTPVTAADTLAYAAYNVENITPLNAARPEIVRAQAEVVAATGDVAATRAARRPDVAVHFNMEEWNSTPAFGLAFLLPFDWGSSRADTQRAQAELCARQQLVEAARLDAAGDVQTARIAIRSADAQIMTLRNQVLQPAQQLAELTTLGYCEGAMTYLDVLEARRTLREACAEYYTALTDYQIALAQLTWAMGCAPLPVASKENAS